MSNNKNDPVIVNVDKDFEDLIEGFLKNRMNELSELKNAIQCKDFNAIDNIAHKMVGSGRTYGFNFITDIGKDIRDAASQMNLEKIQTDVETLDYSFKHLQIQYIDE